MNIIGVVSEYNPFHSGHEYHLKSSKKAIGGDAAVVAVMSGDFVQRGEAAMFSKYARAEAACRSGADLVIELPLPWALSSAEGFARGSACLLAALGADYISFGSEAGETSVLEEIAICLLDPSFNAMLREQMGRDGNISYAAARQKLLEERMGTEKGSLISTPNNILAVEYLKAIYEHRLELKPITVRRSGNGHDMSGGEGFLSASEIRKRMLQNKAVEAFVPAEAWKVYREEIERGRVQTDRDAAELAMLSRLRMLSERDFEALPDASDGLGRRLYKAVCEEDSLDSILAAAKTKRYALSRIRRMCLCACLGIRSGMNDGFPPYARILAANNTGCALLKEIGKKSGIPLINKPAAARTLSADCTKLFALGASAHDFYVLSYRASREKKAGQDWKTGPKIV